MDSQADPQRQFIENTSPYHGALRRIARSYAKSAIDCEDLLQEIWLQLWRSYPSYRRESAYMTFIYRVALNTALSWNRRNSKLSKVMNTHEIEHVTAPSPATTSPHQEALYMAINQLNAVDKATIILALEGRKHSEIGEVLGLSDKAVSVRLVRAKMKLKSILNPVGQKGG